MLFVVDPDVLNDALVRYENALQIFLSQTQNDRPPTLDCVLTVLSQRDRVQVCIEDIRFLSAGQRTKLNQLDKCLRQYSSTLTKVVDLATWRAQDHPPETSWWWYLESPALFSWLERPYLWLARLDWLWMFLTVLLLTIAVTFVLNTLNQILEVGFAGEGTLAVVLQAVLTIGGGTIALTQQGRKALVSLLRRCRIPRQYWQAFSMVTALVLVLIVIGIHDQYLPRLATDWTQRGIEQYQQGRLGGALRNYRKAIALQPDNAKAHYHLGVLYEDVQNREAAIAEYAFVMKSDPEALDRLLRLRAHNNLGRLYILDEKYVAAWSPLERGLSLVKGSALAQPQIQREKYNLLKNMGWLWLQQRQFIEADEVLQAAVALNSQRSAAYCLRAQVLERLKQTQAAQTAWRQCLSGERQIQPEEAIWAAMARQRIAQLKPK